MIPRKVTAQELVEQFQEQGGGPHHALAFDGDGTLWSGDVGEDFFHAATSRELLKEDALPALHQLAGACGASQVDEPNSQATLLFDAYRTGSLGEAAACEMMAWCFAGWDFDTLVELADEVLEQAQLSQRLFTPIRHILEWARSTNTRTIVVSASPDFVVKAATRRWNFAPGDLAACAAARDSRGVLMDHMDRPVPYGSTKVNAARQLLEHEVVLAAFGDNSFDLELLSLSRFPVATCPKPALRERFGELPVINELGEQAG